MINLKKKNNRHTVLHCWFDVMKFNVLTFLHFWPTAGSRYLISLLPSLLRKICLQIMSEALWIIWWLVVTPASGQNFLRARLSEGLHRHHRAATGASEGIFQGDKQCASWSSTLSFREVLLQLKGTTFTCNVLPFILGGKCGIFCQLPTK